MTFLSLNNFFLDTSHGKPPLALLLPISIRPCIKNKQFY